MKTHSWLRALAPTAISLVSLLNPPAAQGAGPVPEGLSEPMLVFVLQMTPEGEALARTLIGREVLTRDEALNALWKMRERQPGRVRAEFEARMRQVDAGVRARINTERVDADAEVLTRLLVQQGLQTSGRGGAIEFLPSGISPAGESSYEAAREGFLDGMLSPNRYKAWDRSTVAEAARAGKSLARARVAALDFTGMRFERIDLRQIEGQYADFSGGLLARADLRDANLPWSGFNGADLYRADLREARLSWALMEHANLTEARAAKAMMAGARLYRANLSRIQARDSAWLAADLSRAKLVDADLRGADLRTVDLREADLTGARLDGADLTGAAYSKGTRLPFSEAEARRRGMFLTEERVRGE